MFITFEGIDGIGKSTQSKILKENLENLGYKVALTRDPGGNDIAEEIRGIILNNNNDIDFETEILLYTAARMQNVKKTIEPLLEEGFIVICDRFYDSTLAYQGYGRGLSINTIKHYNKYFMDNLEPDCTFLMNASEAVLENVYLKRMEKREKLDRIEKEGVEFMKKVAKGFRKLATYDKGERIHVIDATLTVKSNSEKILSIVQENIHVNGYRR